MSKRIKEFNSRREALDAGLLCSGITNASIRGDLLASLMDTKPEIARWSPKNRPAKRYYFKNTNGIMDFILVQRLFGERAYRAWFSTGSGREAIYESTYKLYANQSR